MLKPIKINENQSLTPCLEGMELDGFFITVCGEHIMHITEDEAGKFLTSEQIEQVKPHCNEYGKKL
jgi:hypothetical protein